MGRGLLGEKLRTQSVAQIADQQLRHSSPAPACRRLPAVQLYWTPSAATLILTGATIVLDGGSITGRGSGASGLPSRSGAPAVLRDNLLDLLEERPISTGSIVVMNSTSSIKSTSSSSDQQPDTGIRLAQEFSDHLSSCLPDERKKLIASFLDLVDDETLAVLSARSESEKKSRKKGKDSSKSKKCNQNSRENGNSHTGSVGSSSMEVISEGSQIQSQTSPSAASRKTFAGDFPLSSCHFVLTFHIHPMTQAFYAANGTG